MNMANYTIIILHLSIKETCSCQHDKGIQCSRNFKFNCLRSVLCSCYCLLSLPRLGSARLGSVRLSRISPNALALAVTLTQKSVCSSPCSDDDEESRCLLIRDKSRWKVFNLFAWKQNCAVHEQKGEWEWDGCTSLNVCVCCCSCQQLLLLSLLLVS